MSSAILFGALQGALIAAILPWAIRNRHKPLHPIGSLQAIARRLCSRWRRKPESGGEVGDVTLRPPPLRHRALLSRASIVLVSSVALLVGVAIGLFAGRRHPPIPRDPYIGHRFRVADVTQYIGPGGQFDYQPGENIEAQLLIYVPGPEDHLWSERIHCLFPPDARFTRQPNRARTNPFDDPYTWHVPAVRVVGRPRAAVALPATYGGTASVGDGYYLCDASK